MLFVKYLGEVESNSESSEMARHLFMYLFLPLILKSVLTLPGTVLGREGKKRNKTHLWPPSAHCACSHFFFFFFIPVLIRDMTYTCGNGDGSI